MNLSYLKNTKIPFGLASLGAISYGGFMFDLVMNANIGTYIGFSGLGLLGAGVIGTMAYLTINKNKIEEEIKEKEYQKLKEKIKKEYGHLELNNIFEKVNTIKQLIEEETTKESLFYLRMLGLVNHSLELYIENLEIISKYKEILKLDANEIYKQEIEKNKTQNELIVKKIDMFIKEFLENQNNDSTMGDILQEYERTMNIYDEISNIKKGMK